MIHTGGGEGVGGGYELKKKVSSADIDKKRLLRHYKKKLQVYRKKVGSATNASIIPPGGTLGRLLKSIYQDNINYLSYLQLLWYVIEKNVCFTLSV